MSIPNIETIWDSEEVEQKMLAYRLKSFKRIRKA